MTALPDRCEQERKKALRRRSGVDPRTRKRLDYEKYVWRNYGLTLHDIALMWDKQQGLCPICEAKLETKRWVIEHRHIKGFKGLPAALKAKYFRGLVCNWCNHRVLSMCERAGWRRVYNVVSYLFDRTVLGGK